MSDRFDITRNQLDQLRATGLSWASIASTLGVNRATIYRRRQIFGINTDQAYAFSDISDNDLDALLTLILNNSPNAGETYVQGSLRSRGLRIQRWRVRERLQVYVLVPTKV